MTARSGMLACALLSLTACGEHGADSASRATADANAVDGSQADVQVILERAVAAVDTAAARIDSVFQPLPLLRPADEASLTRHGNAVQLAEARRYGVPRGMQMGELDRLVTDGRLVRLQDTEHYVIRDLDHSAPVAVPAVADFLDELGRRFQEELDGVGAPPYRLEVTSVLRSAEDQAALRRVNPNAAVGESTHEYGTTVDVVYSAYAAPQRRMTPSDEGMPAWLGDHVSRYEAVSLERVAGRRSLELKAILGRVLAEMQAEGRVYVTLERLQPVYHLTVRQQR